MYKLCTFFASISLEKSKTKPGNPVYGLFIYNSAIQNVVMVYTRQNVCFTLGISQEPFSSMLAE